MHQSSYLGYRRMFDHQIERSGVNSLNFVQLSEMRNVYFFSYHNIVTLCATNNSIALYCILFILSIILYCIVKWALFFKLRTGLWWPKYRKSPLWNGTFLFVLRGTNGNVNYFTFKVVAYNYRLGLLLEEDYTFISTSTVKPIKGNNQERQKRYSLLMKENGWTRVELSRQLGMSRSWVTMTLGW